MSLERRMDALEMNDQTEGEKSDRRRHKRFPCEGSAEVRAFDFNILFRGRLRDLSKSGCFVETRAHLKLPRRAQVELRFTACGVKLTVRAHVMDVRVGKGAGFEFQPNDPRLDKTFENLISQLHAEDPATV
jgi:PilZ domain